MQSVKLRSALLSRGVQSTETRTRSPGPPVTETDHLARETRHQSLPVYRPVTNLEPFDTIPPRETPDSYFADIHAEVGLEVLETDTEVEIPTWVTVIHLAQLLSPDLYTELEPALAIGVDPVIGVSLTDDARGAISRLCELIWGPTNLIIPMLSLVPYAVDERGLTCPKKFHPRIQPCPSLPVYVQRSEVSSCSPYENRVLNAKSSYTRGDPINAVVTGLRVASKRYSRLLPSPKATRPELTGELSYNTSEKKRSCTYSWIRSRR